VSFGADQPGTFSLSTITAGLPQNLTSIGLSVVYNVTGNPLTAYVTATARLFPDRGGRRPSGVHAADHHTNTTTGAYTFALLDGPRAERERQ
jgi:hypothetical protein